MGIWGDISCFGITIGKIYMENINGQLYCDILETKLNRSMATFPKETKMVYQEDVTLWQMWNIVKDKIAKLKLRVLDRAPKRPDLNPKEMLW